MILCFTSCTQEPSAQEIVDNVVAAQAEARTYQFELEMTMNTTAEMRGETIEQKVTMNTDGALDMENQQAKFNMTVDAGDEGAGETEAYFADGMMYSKVGYVGEEATWMKEESAVKWWERMTAMSGYDSYQELLETAQVEIIGSENVKGVDCYVLQLTPDMVQLYNTATDPAGGVGVGGRMPPIPEEFAEDIFSSYSVKQWIAKDTYFFVKAEVELSMELTPEDLGFPDEEGEMTIDMVMILLAYDYNQPVSIELPPEAEDAVEMPMGF